MRSPLLTSSRPYSCNPRTSGLNHGSNTVVPIVCKNWLTRLRQPNCFSAAREATKSTRPDKYTLAPCRRPPFRFGLGIGHQARRRNRVTQAGFGLLKRFRCVLVRTMARIESRWPEEMKIKRSLRTAILAALLTFASLRPAWAQVELIANGGFESGSTPWTMSGGAGGDEDQTVPPNRNIG